MASQDQLACSLGYFEREGGREGGSGERVNIHDCMYTHHKYIVVMVSSSVWLCVVISAAHT